MLFNTCNIFMCHWHYDMYYKYTVQISVCVSDYTSLLFRVQLERLGHRVNREIREQRYHTNTMLHQMKKLYFELQIYSCYLTSLWFIGILLSKPLKTLRSFKCMLSPFSCSFTWSNNHPFSMHVRKLIQGHAHTMDNPSIHRIAIPTVLESCCT